MAEAFRPRRHLRVEALTKPAPIAFPKTPELKKLGAWELVTDALRTYTKVSNMGFCTSNKTCSGCNCQHAFWQRSGNDRAFFWFGV